MPELPEVETVCRTIEPLLKGCFITSFELPGGYKKALVNSDLAERFSGARINSVSRRAKFILWNTTAGIVAFHLRMTGRLLTTEPEKIKYVTLTVHLEGGKSVWFSDVRKFGRVYLYTNLAQFESDRKLGVEPLDEHFTPDLLKVMCAASSRQAKPYLLDQTKVTGLGNIYVDECLWKAKIHPQASMNRIGRRKLEVLHSAIVSTLNESIANHGTTFLNFYFDGDKTGNYANRLKVFGRQNLPCPRCSTLIKKIRVAQRGTHYCPRCQRK